MNHVYVNTPKSLNNNIHKNGGSHMVKNSRPIKVEKTIPNLIGTDGYKAISALENVGLQVSYSGVGKVASQSLPKGTQINKKQKIHLELIN